MSLYSFPRKYSLERVLLRVFQLRCNPKQNVRFVILAFVLFFFFVAFVV